MNPLFIFSIIKSIAGFAVSRAQAILDMQLKIAAFIIAHWRIILPAAIVAYCLFQVHAARVEAAKNRQLYTDLVAEVAAEKEARRILSTALYLKAEAAAFLRNQHYQSEQAMLLANAQSKIAQEIKSHDRTENSLNTRLDRYRDGLLLAAKRYATAEDTLAGIQSASANGDATIPGQVAALEEELAVCKEAGAMCAADYNYCYQYVNDVRKAYDETQN